MPIKNLQFYIKGKFKSPNECIKFNIIRYSKKNSLHQADRQYSICYTLTTLWNIFNPIQKSHMSNKINLTCVLVVSCITAFLKCSLESELPISLGSVHRAPVAQENTTPNYQSYYSEALAHEY